MIDLWLNTILCLAAFTYHVLEKWSEYRRDVGDVPFSVFWRVLPAQHSATVVATVVAFVGCYALDWMNPLAAVACGYMGDSLTRRIADKFVP